MPIEGAFASGNDDDDRATVVEIRRQLEAGNVAAWCCLFVTAEWRGFKGYASLGGCSYASEEELRASELEDMKAQALDALNEDIETKVRALQPRLLVEGQS